MQEKDNKLKTNTFSMETKDISFQERVRRETEKKNAEERELLRLKEEEEENKRLKREAETIKKEEDFKTLKNKFDYDETRKKLKSIIENPQLKTLIEKMGKEAGLEEASSPIDIFVGDFNREDLYLARKNESFNEEDFIFKHSNAKLSFKWGEYEVPSSNDEIGGYSEGYTSFKCVFTLEIQIDNSGSVLVPKYGWDIKDNNSWSKPIKKYSITKPINSLNELFEKITSAYIDSFPALEEEATRLNREKEEEWRKRRPYRLRDYKETLLRRKKELLKSSLSNKVKDALGLMDYKNHFTEQELKDLEDIENGKDLVDFE